MAAASPFLKTDVLGASVRARLWQPIITHFYYQHGARRRHLHRSQSEVKEEEEVAHQS